MKILRLGLLTLFLTLASSSSQAFFFSFSSDFGDDWYYGDGWYYDYYGYNTPHPYYSRYRYHHPRYRNYVASNPYACRTDEQVNKTEKKVENN